MKRFLAIFILLSLCLTGCSTQLLAADDLRTVPEPEELSVSMGIPRLNTEDHIAYMDSPVPDRFMPDALMRRGETCQILYSLMENPVEGSCSFSDVHADSRYYESVACLAAWGIVSDSTGPFRPNELLTWGQLLTMLGRFYPSPAEGDVPYVGSFLGRRADVAEAEMLPGIASFAGTREHWAYSAVENAVARGWLTPGGSLLPDMAVTRLDFCRLMNTVLNRQADLGMAMLCGEDLPVFSDIPSSDPDYGTVLEACYAHEYHRSENGFELWENAELEPGFHRKNGRLFYVQENGELLRNGSLGLLTFDEHGRYTSGVPATDDKVAEVLQSLGTDDMSDWEALRAAYYYCARNKFYYRFPWASYGCEIDAQEKPYRALHFLEVGGGNCYDFSAAFGYMARSLGYNAYIVYAQINEFYAPHGWVVIPENGVNYIYDPEMEATRPWRHDGFDLFRMTNHSIYHYWYSPWW